MGVSRRGLFAAGLAALALPGCGGGGATQAAPDRKVEVFSWWAGPGEKEGLEALVADFARHNPGVAFDNAAVAGGAGTIARTVLATRLQNDDPPDSYQAHAGRELTADITSGYVEDLQEQGWLDKLPEGLVQAITVNGTIYCVPVNIHRSNLLWYNPKTLAGLGLTPPSTWADFLTQADAIAARGLTPLSIGPAWTLKHLLENVLLGQLGAQTYAELWTGGTDWEGAAVLAALRLFTDGRAPRCWRRCGCSPTGGRRGAGGAAAVHRREGAAVLAALRLFTDGRAPRCWRRCGCSPT
ncbi:ABC transporter substrate-binding protein [Dactylosporangium sp. McL0621]|uniref:ABC transporter substrate-binding protein n=1 Tax=Dactylosporangium sp. McL0621 TaxID=3415678 RepID=UPI003CFB26AF